MHMGTLPLPPPCGSTYTGMPNHKRNPHAPSPSTTHSGSCHSASSPGLMQLCNDHTGHYSDTPQTSFPPITSSTLRHNTHNGHHARLLIPDPTRRPMSLRQIHLPSARTLFSLRSLHGGPLQQSPLHTIPQHPRCPGTETLPPPLPRIIRHGPTPA